MKRLSPIALGVILQALFLLPVAVPARGEITITVAASIFPLYDLAREVGGARAQVFLLVPPGAEAHHWEPRPSDLAQLGQADLFVHLGPFFERWATRAARSAGVRNVLAVAEDVPLREGDPHLWLDLMQDVRIADALAREFSRLDPLGVSAYRANAEALKRKLLALDQRYRSALADCRGREFLVAGHAAFGHLAARYGLAQIAVSGLSPDSEPTPHAVAAVVKEARAKGIKVVFHEGPADEKLARAIAGEIGGRTALLFPGHELTAAQWKEGATFLGLMEGNLASLRGGLGCD
jgi:zinc transport system substrate-binding protein